MFSSLSAYHLHAWVTLLKSSFLHIMSVCAYEIFHAHKEITDKMATVCPACLLYLNVCVWCQFIYSEGQSGCLSTTASEWTVWNDSLDTYPPNAQNTCLSSSSFLYETAVITKSWANTWLILDFLSTKAKSSLVSEHMHHSKVWQKQTKCWRKAKPKNDSVLSVMHWPAGL